MKYRSRVEPSNNKCNIVHHKDYLYSVKEIRDSNLDFDTYALEYHNTISKFPEFTISEILNEFTLKLSKNLLDMLYIEVNLHNTKLNFLLDTGAEVSCISLPHATEANGIILSEQQVHVGGADGHFSHMQVCFAQKLNVSELNIENLPMLVLKENQLSLNVLGKSIIRIDGILGWDILQNLDFVLDYKMSKLKILQTKKRTGTGNFIKSIFPVVLALDDNNNIKKFGVDIGAKKSWLSDTLVEKDQLDVVTVKRKKIYGVNGTVILNSSVVSKYAIDIGVSKLVFKNISTGFTGLLNSFELDGVLGIDIIKENRLVIMNSENSMKFE